LLYSNTPTASELCYPAINSINYCLTFFILNFLLLEFKRIDEQIKVIVGRSVGADYIKIFVFPSHQGVIVSISSGCTSQA
jgi:hypothetical protein